MIFEKEIIILSHIKKSYCLLIFAHTSHKGVKIMIFGLLLGKNPDYYLDKFYIFMPEYLFQPVAVKLDPYGYFCASYTPSKCESDENNPGQSYE